MSLIRLLRQIKNDSDMWQSEAHGITHWDRVMENALMIGIENGADLKIVEYFAYLHDCCRENEWDDPQHGPRAAAFAKRKRDLFDLNDIQFKLLIRACSGHTHAHPNGRAGLDPTLAACWDGDRLDLGRVGITPDPNRLFSDQGKEYAIYNQSIGFDYGDF
jgi:uncharacterized protein